MAWWNRRKRPATPPIPDFNPATDEASLDRCVRRLQEILEEVGPIGQFLEKASKRVDQGPDFEDRLFEAIDRDRIPGFCGYKLLVEASTLVELMGVRVVCLRNLHGKTGDTNKIRKLDEIQAFMEEVEPRLLEALAENEIYNSPNIIDHMHAVLKRYLDRRSTA